MPCLYCINSTQQFWKDWTANLVFIIREKGYDININIMWVCIYGYKLLPLCVKSRSEKPVHCTIIFHTFIKYLSVLRKNSEAIFTINSTRLTLKVNILKCM